MLQPIQAGSTLIIGKQKKDCANQDKMARDDTTFHCRSRRTNSPKENFSDGTSARVPGENRPAESNSECFYHGHRRFGLGRSQKSRTGNSIRKLARPVARN